MKKKLLGIISFLLFTNYIYANEDYIINKQNIKITKQEYNNLKSIGFTDYEIKLLDKKTFDANKNINGKILSQEKSNFFIKTKSITPGFVETEYKKITTTIIKIQDMYRYKITVEWKKMPYIRSYDIIAIGKASNLITNGTIFFVQNYCYKSGNCSSNYEYIPKYSNSGNGASFQLVKEKNLTDIIITFFYDIKKSSSDTITKLDAYGDYKHATKTISQEITYSINWIFLF